jgi:hypothetical protein
MQDTSVQAYAQLASSGELSKLQTEVYQCLKANGPLTQGETWSKFFSTYQRHDICPRFAELKNSGLIKEIGKRKCGLTKRLVLIWATSDYIAPDFNRNPSVKDRLILAETILKENNLLAAYESALTSIGGQL